MKDFIQSTEGHRAQKVSLQDRIEEVLDIASNYEQIFNTGKIIMACKLL